MKLGSLPSQLQADKPNRLAALGQAGFGLGDQAELGQGLGAL